MIIDEIRRYHKLALLLRLSSFQLTIHQKGQVGALTLLFLRPKHCLPKFGFFQFSQREVFSPSDSHDITAWL